MLWLYAKPLSSSVSLLTHKKPKGFSYYQDTEISTTHLELAFGVFSGRAASSESLLP